MTTEVVMVSSLLLVGAGAVYASYKDTKSVRTALNKIAGSSHIHQLLGAVIIVAHASEIGRVFTHLTWAHALAAIALFAIWLVNSQTSVSEIA